MIFLSAARVGVVGAAFLAALLAGSALSAAGRPVRQAPLDKLGAGEGKPNILFIFSDDHALRTISAYAGGGGMNRTPNIDRLAEQGAVFTRSFCGNSICQPSRASILTGKHSHKNGVLSNGSKWDPKQVVFPRLLKAAGYQTAMIGKWHMHPFPSDEFEYHKTLSGHGGQGRYYNPEFVTMDGETVVEEGYSTDVITNESIEWLEGRDKERPFLLMTQFKSPHTNVMPALRHLGMFADVELPVPASYHSDLAGRNGYLKETWMRMHGMSAPDVIKTGPAKGKYELPGEDRKSQQEARDRGIPGFYSYMTPEQLDAWHAHYDPLNEKWARRLAEGKVSEKEKKEFPYQRYVKDYLRCVAAIDENVGRLIDWVDKAGIADNTIVIYSSDQGFFLGENGWTDKRLMDEVTMQMPFLIRWPGRVKPGQRISSDDSEHRLRADLPRRGREWRSRRKCRAVRCCRCSAGEVPEDWRKSLFYQYHQAGAYNLPKIEGVRTDRPQADPLLRSPEAEAGGAVGVVRPGERPRRAEVGAR
jgi:arylsulfatase A-like enzyme